MKLLKPEQVADILNVSRSSAYEIVRRLPFRVYIGEGRRRALRVPDVELIRWIEEGGDGRCEQAPRDSTSAIELGGVGDTTPKDDDGAPPLNAETDSPRKRVRASSNASGRIRIVYPRSRSTARSGS